MECFQVAIIQEFIEIALEIVQQNKTCNCNFAHITNESFSSKPKTRKIWKCPSPISRSDSEKRSWNAFDILRKTSKFVHIARQYHLKRCKWREQDRNSICEPFVCVYRVSLIEFSENCLMRFRKFSPRTDSSPEPVQACDCESLFAASDNCGTASALPLSDSIFCRARRLAACCTIRRRNSRRESPCPSTQRARFPQCWRRGSEPAWYLKIFSTLFDAPRGKVLSNFTFLASSAFGRKEVMVIVDTVNLVVDINRERHAIKAFIAHATTEASRMIRLAHGM